MKKTNLYVCVILKLRIHIRRQFFVGPVRAIKPTPRRAGFHPCLDRRPQRLGNPPRLARCPVDLQALHAAFVIVLEPEPYRGTMHPQILRDGLALSSPARHQDRLTPVTEASVIGRLEDVFQVLLFHCRQLNPPHLCQPPLLRNLTRGYLRKDAMSSGACMRALQPQPLPSSAPPSLERGPTEPASGTTGDINGTNLCIYVNADQVDSVIALQVSDSLTDMGITAFLSPEPDPGQPPEKIRSAQQALLEECSGVVLVYGQTPATWVQAQFAFTRRVIA